MASYRHDLQIRPPGGRCRHITASTRQCSVSQSPTRGYHFPIRRRAYTFSINAIRRFFHYSTSHFTVAFDHSRNSAIVWVQLMTTSRSQGGESTMGYHVIHNIEYFGGNPRLVRLCMLIQADCLAVVRGGLLCSRHSKGTE